jgi:hypothetical protein
MDTHLTDQIRHHLKRYEDSIDEIDRHFNQLAASGPGCAGVPYLEKNRITRLLHTLDTNDPRFADFVQEYGRITGKLGRLEQKRGPVYRELLFADLKHCLDRYHAAVCHASISSISVESDPDLLNRDLILVLLAELKKDFDVSGIEQVIGMLDNEVRSISAPGQEKDCESSLPAPVPAPSGSRRGVLSE